MPPRGMVVAVVVFWIAMSCVLVQREIVPRWRAGDAPAYPIELTDEAGSPQVDWHVFQKDNRVGSGMTQVRRQPDRTFEMSQQFRFTDLKLPVPIELKRLDTVYRVTREGRLLAIKLLGQASAGPVDLVVELEGEVKDGYLEPRIKLFGSPVDLQLGKFAVAEHGSILNPMHLVHRLPRLHPGQHWKVPLFDPIKMFSANELLRDKVPALMSRPAFLEAEVTADTMTWDRAEVDCLRVSYREPAKDEIARTWVRRTDGLVLAQEMTQRGYEIAIRRVPEVPLRP